MTGPGGVGKTRLATAVAHRQLPRRLDGVWLVDLAAGPRPPEVASETARVLGLQAGSGTAVVDALRRYLAERDALVVLDNCEHVIGQCAEVAGALLRSCPHVRILATSREPLGVDGETVWRLEPLALEDAHRLFVERARQRRPEFLSDEDTEATIATLCDRLDRLPLAIELAAARMSALSPREILRGVEEHLDELGTVRRQSPAHHRSVRAAVEWSHQLLDASEQEAFRHLAVFVGGFDAEAAKAVAPGLSLEVLARLVDKSVVTAVPRAGGRTRYRMLETVREHAHELLVAAGELDSARERHFRHFLSLGNESREPWQFARVEHFVGELEADYGNVRSAVEWAAVADPCGALRLLSGMLELFLALGQADGRRLAEVVLDGCPARDRNRANVQISAGVLAWWTGDAEAARRFLAEARAVTAGLGDRALEGWAWIFEGLLEVFRGSAGQAREHFEEGRRLHREVGVRAGEGRSTAAIGLTFMLENDSARARQLVEEGLGMAVAADDRFGEGQAHTYLGMIFESSGNERTASSHYRAALGCLRPYQGAPLLPIALVGQARVLGHRDPATALKVAAAAWALRVRVGGELPPLIRARLDEVHSVADAALGAEAGRIWKEGLRLSVDDAIALATGAPRRRAAPADGLSVRERDVAALVAEGSSNKEIAARLHLSVRTVESHIRHVLTKVGLANRTQLATWMHQRNQ
ncbi:MAG: LuxR C-terminal-related transcriptional regulator [Actinomycetota bacterium]|nr:LuxR C-terminal-related transcriptional regulator [Actinomycetota bacterium]